jgi:penicillin-binding protein 1C
VSAAGRLKPAAVHPERARKTLGTSVKAALVLLAITLAALVHSLDSRLTAPPPSHLLLDRRGRYLGEVPSSNEMLGYWPLPAVLPEKIARATLEIEDRNFHDHPGVHWPSLFRALWQNVTNLRIVSGASTIAMQVARMQHPDSRSLWAKTREAAEALLLIRAHGHDQVLRQYLTLAPYGNRAHGVVRASRLYFDKPAEDLSWLQASFLAALPQQPGRMSPWTEAGQKRALSRAKRILHQLKERGVISAEDYRQANASELGLVPRPHRQPESMHAVLAWSKELRNPGAPLVATATLDLDVQRIAARAVTENVSKLHWANASNSAALVADVGTGEILGYVGSADYFDEERKGAIDFLQTKRSPGSSLKPFIYGLALEKGTHTAASELPDVPTEFPTVAGGTYVPENMSHSFMGPMLFRQALGNSRNIPALRLLSDVGVEHALELFQRGGVSNLDASPGHYGLGLAIGALQVTPLELGNLYLALASGGEMKPLRRWGEQPAGKPTRLLSREASQMITHLLSDAEARRPGFPVGGPLDFDYAVAIKTGTSQGYRDAWAVAFSDRLLVVTWVGNPDQRRMNQVSGATGAAPAAHEILDAVMPLRAAHLPWAMGFAPPTSWVPREICPLSGKLAGLGCPSSKTEFFAPGTEPDEQCRFHIDVKLDARNGLLASAACPAAQIIHRPMLALPPVYETWARRQRLEIAPTRESPLCPSALPSAPRIAITEPRAASRFLFDPDTPRELSTVRLAASVAPATEEIVWLVDGSPVAQVGWPHELRVALSPGSHTIRAAFVHREGKSAPVVISVDD